LRVIAAVTTTTRTSAATQMRTANYSRRAVRVRGLAQPESKVAVQPIGVVEAGCLTTLKMRTSTAPQQGAWVVRVLFPLLHSPDTKCASARYFTSSTIWEEHVAQSAPSRHPSRSEIAHWPHSLRPPGYYDTNGRVHVPI
jgi:hypothetical protein